MSREAAFAFAAVGDWERAVTAAQQALADEPDDASAHALLALGLAQTNQARSAVDEGRRAVALDPELPFAHYALGAALLEYDEVVDAERSARAALRLEASADGHALLGRCLVQRRRWRDALEEAQRGLQLDAEHTGCANLRALALGSLGRGDEAESVLERTLALDPEDAGTHVSRGWVLLRQAKYDEALESFRTALGLDPSSDVARAGVVEALKARNGLYRVFLRYGLWIGNLDARTRWFILIGLFLLTRTARALLRQNPDWAPVLGPALVVYGVFAVSTWLAEPLSNLLLRLNRFGRLVLTRAEITAANLVGGCLLMAACAVPIFALTGATAWLALAVTGVLLPIPISGAFTAIETRAWPYLRTGVILLALCGAAAFGLSFVSLQLGGIAFVAFVLGVLAFGWAANYVIIKFT